MLTSVLCLRLMKGFFQFRGGVELALTNLAVALGVGIAGPGAYSIEAVLGTTLHEVRIAVVVAIGVTYVIVLTASNTIAVSRRARR